jgi:dihydroorotase
MSPTDPLRPPTGPETWLFRGIRIVDPATGRDERGDLSLRDGVIVAPGAAPVGRVVDAAALTAVPGLIDLHVHLREPGGEDAETVASGLQAAARGGFTTVVAMPNTRPPCDTPGEVAALLRRAAAAAGAEALPAACITRGRAGHELADLAALAAAGAAAFTDDGNVVADAALMRRALAAAKALGRPVMQHALEPTLAGEGVMHAGAYAQRLGLPGIPAEAEAAIVARDVALAAETGGAVHVQHLSVRESLPALREARRRGLPVSAEATPHHLALCDEDVRFDNPGAFKMNPPLGSRADREALLEAVADGTIAALATDHAPHTAAAKARGFLQAPFGVVGLETAVGVTHQALVESGRLPLLEWVRRWTAGPARVLGRPAPSLQPGQPATCAILDLATPWTVRPDEFASRSRNTPFGGWSLRGRALWTFRDGRRLWGPEGSGVRSAECGVRSAE